MILDRDRSTLLSLLLILAGLAAACAAPDPAGPSGAAGSKTKGGEEATTGGETGSSTIDLDPGENASPPAQPDQPEPDCTADCTDFPEEPLIDDQGESINTAELSAFQSQGFSTGLCLLEPQLSEGSTPGAVFPANWLRPRFRWNAPEDASLFEIRLSHPAEKNDLVAYTKRTEWKIPPEIWTQMGKNLHTPITATVRAVTPDGISGTSGEFSIAPVYAGGSLVFWATRTVGSENDSRLLGFEVGDEGVALALDLPDIQMDGVLAPVGGYYYNEGHPDCMGCHTSTPDGKSVIIGGGWPWYKMAVSIEPETRGQVPEWLTPGGEFLLKLPWQGTPAISPAHWNDSDRILVTSLGNRSTAFTDNGQLPQGLVWMNLGTKVDVPRDFPSLDWQVQQDTLATWESAFQENEGIMWGTIAREGDPREAVTPDFNNEGTLIAYTSTTGSENGHPSKSNASVPADIYLVDYNKGQGGTARPLEGADDPEAMEYYPAFTPDSAFIAFNKAPSGSDHPYDNEFSEISLVPTEGGSARRLLANDPPTCSGLTSPGLTNSWPKWSPLVKKRDGLTYYFIVFSSQRSGYGPKDLDPDWAQLYFATIVVDDSTGAVTDYPAIYIWNQSNLVEEGNVQEYLSNNLTPAWEDFVVPSIDVVVR